MMRQPLFGERARAINGHVSLYAARDAQPCTRWLTDPPRGSRRSPALPSFVASLLGVQDDTGNNEHDAQHADDDAPRQRELLEERAHQARHEHSLPQIRDGLGDKSQLLWRSHLVSLYHASKRGSSSFREFREFRGQGTEVRSQKSEVREQRVEGRIRMTEVSEHGI